VEAQPTELTLDTCLKCGRLLNRTSRLCPKCAADIIARSRHAPEWSCTEAVEQQLDPNPWEMFRANSNVPYLPSAPLLKQMDQYIKSEGIPIFCEDVESFLSAQIKAHALWVRLVLLRMRSPIERLIWISLLFHPHFWRYVKEACPDHPVSVGDHQFYLDIALITHDGRRLDVECDGAPYHDEEQQDYDAWRQRLLEQQGWNVLRFTGSQIHNDPLGCAQRVIAELAGSGGDRRG